MKKNIILSLIPFAASIAISCNNTSSSTPVVVERPSADEVMATTQKAADWQIDHFEFQGKYRTLGRFGVRKKWHHRNKYSEKIAFSATLYDGLYHFSKVSSNGDKYLDWVAQKAEDNNYELEEKRIDYAHIAIGALYLELAEIENNPALYKNIQDQLDKIIETMSVEATNWQRSDYIYMTAPAFAMMSKATGDSKYVEYMDKQLHNLFKLLYDEQNKLIFRDKGYIEKVDEDGNNIFWSRGCGWAMTGLAKLIPLLEEGSEMRTFYEEKFQQLAHSLKDLQAENGSWPIELLAKSHEEPIESSGTSLITYGLAWGLNSGLLEREDFEQTIFKAWYLLDSAVAEDGLVGYSQSVDNFTSYIGPHFTELYAAGAFLCAGSEIYKYLSE